MSKTDKTRPWWVRMAEAPMVNCRPVHDHRFGPCTLPEEITADSASMNRSGRSGCYWGATDHYLFDCGSISVAGSGTTSDAKSAAAAVTRRAASCAPTTAKSQLLGPEGAELVDAVLGALLALPNAAGCRAGVASTRPGSGGGIGHVDKGPRRACAGAHVDPGDDVAGPANPHRRQQKVSRSGRLARSTWPHHGTGHVWEV